MRAYLEAPPATSSDAVHAWSFDLAAWGVRASGSDASAAGAELARLTGAGAVDVAEIVRGRDVAFSRDLEPATAGERIVTRATLLQSRARTLELLEAVPHEVRVRTTGTPGLASPFWASGEQFAGWVAELESRVWLPRLGLPARPALDEPFAELRASADHVAGVIERIDAGAWHVTADGAVWTTVKLFRHIAWFEQSHHHILESLLA